MFFTLNYNFSQVLKPLPSPLLVTQVGGCHFFCVSFVRHSMLLLFFTPFFNLLFLQSFIHLQFFFILFFCCCNSVICFHKHIFSVFPCVCSSHSFWVDHPIYFLLFSPALPHGRFIDSSDSKWV